MFSISSPLSAMNWPAYWPNESPSTARNAASASSSLIDVGSPSASDSASTPRNDSIRSSTERPVSGLEPSASTISGSRRMRSWLFETISTTFLCGSAASFTTVASDVDAFSAIFSSRAASPSKRLAKNDNRAGWLSPSPSTESVTGSGRFSRLSRAVDLTSASASCISANRTARELGGREGQGAARRHQAYVSFGASAAGVASPACSESVQADLLRFARPIDTISCFFAGATCPGARSHGRRPRGPAFELSSALRRRRCRRRSLLA